MKLKLDLKIMIGVLTIVAALGGFYYTTQIRLDTLEETSKHSHQINHDVMVLQEQVQQLKKRIKRLEDR